MTKRDRIDQRRGERAERKVGYRPIADNGLSARLRDRVEGSKAVTASLEITGPALAAIAGHLRDLRQGSPNEDWVPALIWGPRGVKMDGEKEWSDLGVGFSLGFYTRDQLEAIPPEAIAAHGDLEVVIMNSSHDPNAFEGKKVILDDKQFMLAD